MASKMKLLILMLLLLFVLSGCALLTLEELYCLPKRSEDYENLQSLIDEAMEDLTYCAPNSGDNRQSVQTVDLDGDGNNEYLLFAKDESENPLKILIYSQVASGYALMDTIEGYGFAFDFVQYAQMDDKPGLEIIVGRQVSEELPRSISVYRFSSGYARQMLSTGYTGMACEDMDQDGIHDLILFTAGVSERGNGIAVLYSYENEALERTVISHLSKPISHFQQVETGLLQDGSPAVFVTSSEDEYNLKLDILAVLDHNLVNLTEGIPIPSVRNYYLYPVDIDEDGIVEIPNPRMLPALSDDIPQEFIIQWYALDQAGTYTVKDYTYHHHSQGWYIRLLDEWIKDLIIIQDNGNIRFCTKLSDDQIGCLFTIYTLTGSDRESEEVLEDKLLLFKGDSIVYAAKLGELASEYNIQMETIQEIFEPIRKEWNTEEDRK